MVEKQQAGPNVFVFQFSRPRQCSWRGLVALVLLLPVPSSSLPVIGRSPRKKVTIQYLYRDLPNNGGDPIIDYHDETNRPDFLYQENFPYHRVVEFYSPLCGHCVKFAPQYIKFANDFQQVSATRNHDASGLQVKFYAVSCTVHGQICKDQGINGYPTTKVYPKGTSQKGISMKYYELNAKTLVKTLGVTTVDDAKEMDAQEVTATETEASPTNPDDKPAFMKRKPNEVFSDAYLSFHTAMKTAVFIDASGTLTAEKQSVLKRWLQTLQRVLPPWRIHTLLEALLGGPNRQFAAVIVTEEAFQSILDAHPPRTREYSDACQLHESPYTCGLWTLFHMLTVGVVKFNSAIVNPDASKDVQFNTQVVSKLIRDFVQHFLLCDPCVQHFVGEYDACAYGRCTRLRDGRNPGTPDDWKELPLWLLETHNGVNVRLQQDRMGTTPATVEQQRQVMWPPVTDCPNCWFQTGVAAATSQYNHTVMYNYLRLAYGAEDSETEVTYLAASTAENDNAPKETTAHSATAKLKPIRGTGNLSRGGDIAIPTEVQYILLVGMVLLGAYAWHKRSIRRLLSTRSSKDSL